MRWFLTYCPRKADTNFNSEITNVSVLVTQPVNITTGKFENNSFISTVLPSTLIRHKNGTFRKGSSNRRNLKTLALRFSVDGKHFETEVFESDDVTIDHVISSTNPEWPTIVTFSYFFCVVWTQNTWCVFRVKSLFSNFSGVVWTGREDRKHFETGAFQKRWRR